MAVNLMTRMEMMMRRTTSKKVTLNPSQKRRRSDVYEVMHMWV